jgi:hypothetical protein
LKWVKLTLTLSEINWISKFIHSLFKQALLWFVRRSSQWSHLKKDHWGQMWCHAPVIPAIWEVFGLRSARAKIYQYPISTNKPDMVAHVWNSSSLEVTVRRITDLSGTQVKMQDPIWQMTKAKEGWGCDSRDIVPGWRMWGPDIKLQNLCKPKQREKINK